MYSPFDHVAAPATARPWREVFGAPLQAWSADYLRETTAAREDIKRRFSGIVLSSP
jgi:hypothetical protein